MNIKREKWIETHDENGKSAEYLMDNCTHCGRPWARSKVLRLSGQELKEWGTLRKRVGFSGTEALLQLLGVFSVPAIAVFTIVFWGRDAAWEIENYGVELLGFAFYGIPVLIGFLFFLVSEMTHRYRKKITTKRQREILARHENVPLEKISMIDQFPTEYVILPEGEMLEENNQKGEGK